MRQTEFARVASVHSAFRPAPGRGTATDMGPYHKPMKRRFTKAVRRLGKFLAAEACALDMEGDDTAPIQFTFASPAYYCPECGARYEDQRDMEECADKHNRLREIAKRYQDDYFDWVEAYERDLDEMHEWAASMRW